MAFGRCRATARLAPKRPAVIAIVAEGVETAEEFALARTAGCRRFRGYFFGRPAPRDKASALCVAAREPLALAA